MAITTRALAAIKPGKWLTEDARRGAGRLAVYGMKSGGAAFYFRYTRADGTRDSMPLGHYDPKGGDGLTLQQASAKAGELSRRYQAGEHDLRGALEAEERARQEQAAAAERAVEAAKAKATRTLGTLLEAYVDQLRRTGKVSMASVEGALRRHVEAAWPQLWATAATEITADDLLNVIARLADAGKLREAAKLRSYLKAAFGAAIRARQDARGSQSLRAMKITSNPAADLVTIEGANQARERALSEAELRAYWRRISALPGASGALLRFHLLTGGQRAEQLGRLTMADFDRDLQTIRLRDGKGRRKVARIHDVPLIPAALEAVQAMQGGALGPYLCTVTAGESGAVYATLQHRVREVAEAMLEAGELEKGVFTVGDLRRTVETRLAAAGVSLEVRAQLQSHGLGGIQARHYDKHGYGAEKRAALETLHRLLTEKSGGVVQMKRRRM